MSRSASSHAAPRRVAATVVGVLLLAPCLAAADLDGADLYGLCTQCHGAEGGGNELFLAPAIAGLDRWYVESTLKKFKTGVRGTHPDDLGGLRMYPMSLALRSDEQIATVSEYVSEMPRVRPDPTLSGGDASKGAQAYSALCQQCHGEEGAGNEAQFAPRLSGTSDWYLLSSLKKYKDGVRGTNPQNPFGIAMRGMTMSLADEQAMMDVIAHIMTLPD